MWAAPVHPNLGVATLAEGAAELARRAFGSGIEVLFRGTGGTGDGPMNIGHVPPLLKELVVKKRGLASWLRSFDLIIDMRGGDSFTDIYGLQRLASSSIVPRYAAHLGVPVVLGPQTIGPFKTARGRLIAKQVLKSARLVIGRDPVSGYAAQQLGRPVDLIATDVAFAAFVPEPASTRSDVVLNVSGLLWGQNPHVDHEHYREAVRSTIRGLAESQREITLLAHVVGSSDAAGDNDRYALAELNSEFGGALRTLEPGSVDEVRSILRASNLLIGARMHACLNALAVGTPAVPMAYSRKFAPLLDSIGWRYTVDLGQPPSTVAEQVLDSAKVDFASQVRTTIASAEDKVESAVHALRGLV